MTCYLPASPRICCHLRVDYKNATDLEANMKFVTEIKSLDSLMILERKTTNDVPHFHALFWFDKTLSTLRQQWKKLFPAYDGKKNEYCIKVVPELEVYDTEKYLCKGENALTPPDVFLQTGKYSVERTIELHLEYWARGGPRVKEENKEDIRHYGETIITHRVEKVVKPKKNFYNDVIEYLNRQFPDRVWNLRDSPIMLNAILKLHGKHFRPYGPQQLENEMNVIMNILVFDSHSSEMYDVLKNRGNIPFL